MFNSLDHHDELCSSSQRPAQARRGVLLGRESGGGQAKRRFRRRNLRKRIIPRTCPEKVTLGSVKETVQAHVKAQNRYEELKDDSYWRLVDTDGKTQDQVFDEVMKIVTDLIDKSQGQDLAELWSTPTSPVNGNPKRPRLSRSENFQTNTNSNGIEH